MNGKLLSSKGTYIGAHPMTGKEKSGYENSDALLFENSVFIVCTENGKSKLFDEYIMTLVKHLVQECLYWIHIYTIK